MNLNKYTKAELISKLKRSESKIDSNKISRKSVIAQTKTYFLQLIDLVLVFKSILIKLTLISFFIQIFKIYKIFRRIWVIFNTIVMSIFGISLLDNFGFEFFTNFIREVKFILGNTVDYFTNTHFYKYLSNIFSNKEEIPTSEHTNTNEKSILRQDIKLKTENVEGIRENNRNSKISEWLKPESDFNQENKVDKVEENSKSTYKKYIVISGIIIVTSLSWYYFPEIKENAISLWEWLTSFRAGAPNSGTGDEHNNGSGNTTPTGDNLQGPRVVVLSNESINKQTPTIDSPVYDEYFKSPDKGKVSVLTSPSLDDLNQKVSDSWERSKSPTGSSSSTETIKAPTGNFADNVILENVDKNWKSLIEPGIKDSIEYVESHFPQSDIDDTSYIQTMIKEIKNHNINLAQSTLAENKISKIPVNRLKTINALVAKTDLWIEEMEEKINNLD